MDKEIGKVIHFFDKISVAVVALTGPLAVGDKVKFINEKHGVNFEQTITSLQLDHKEISKATTGSEVATKTDQPVKEGTLLYKIS